MTTTIKVLTLNCWGVFTPLACQYRSERMEEIGKVLKKGEYDVVLLQEIWTQADYDKLCEAILPAMPYTHYFHSGMFGTGCCIFSKFSILDTFLYKFSLNGYAHKPQHGDWFGGKGVGLAKVLVKDLTVNFYVTHTHAQYNEEKDEYEAHRVAQGFEMGQFIKLTSDSCDAVIVGGDFNFQPKDLGFKLIKYNGNLQDAWIKQEDTDLRGHCGTCDNPENDFTTARKRVEYPQGKCIDFLMFRNNSGYDMYCEKCYLTMRKVPKKPFNYSDHEGVAALFRIRKNPTAMALPRETDQIEQHFSDAIPLLDEGMKRVKAGQVFYVACCILCLVALAFIGELSMPFGLGFLVTIAWGLLACGTAFCFWMAVVMNNRELNGMIAARKDINNLLKANPQK